MIVEHRKKAWRGKPPCLFICGPDWTRTSEGITPADLQSAPFAARDTDPSKFQLSGHFTGLIFLCQINLAVGGGRKFMINIDGPAGHLTRYGPSMTSPNIVTQQMQSQTGAHSVLVDAEVCSIGDIYLPFRHA